MAGQLREICGSRVLFFEFEQGQLIKESQALDLVAAAFEHEADTLAISAGQLGDGFFQLETRLAGEVTQKLVNYRIRLVVLGDISAYVQRSKALADFVSESNRGANVWFLDAEEDLTRRLFR